MQIDVLHRNDLRIAAAGGAALHAEHRSQARFAQADDGLLADLVQRIAESDRGRGLALAGRRGAQGGHQNELAVGLVLQAVDVVERDLGLVVAVVLDARGGNAEAGGDFGDRLQGCALRDLNIGTHGYSQCGGGLDEAAPLRAARCRAPERSGPVAWLIAARNIARAIAVSWRHGEARNSGRQLAGRSGRFCRCAGMSPSADGPRSPWREEKLHR